MRISELVEAIGTVGPSSMTSGTDGVPKIGNTPAPQNTPTNISSQDMAKQNAQLKNNITNIKSVLQKAGGGNINVDKLSQTIATQAPGQTIDPMSVKSLQSMLPAIADALKHPQTANSLKQALGLGVQQQITQQQAQQTAGQTATQPK
jgi:hypothetical protein